MGISLYSCPDSVRELPIFKGVDDRSGPAAEDNTKLLCNLDSNANPFVELRLGLRPSSRLLGSNIDTECGRGAGKVRGLASESLSISLSPKVSSCCFDVVAKLRLRGLKVVVGEGESSECEFGEGIILGAEILPLLNSCRMPS